jgi:hypothetical protein
MLSTIMLKITNQAFRVLTNNPSPNASTCWLILLSVRERRQPWHPYFGGFLPYLRSISAYQRQQTFDSSDEFRLEVRRIDNPISSWANETSERD